jgi:hypothetical protein
VEVEKEVERERVMEVEREVEQDCDSGSESEVDSECVQYEREHESRIYEITKEMEME